MSDEVRQPIDTKANCGRCRFLWAQVWSRADDLYLCVQHEEFVNPEREACFEFRCASWILERIRYVCGKGFKTEKEEHDFDAG